MHGVSTICMGMSRNGATTGMTRTIIRVRLRVIQQVYKRALPVSSEVVAGATLLEAVVRLFAIPTCLAPVATVLVSVLSAVPVE